MPFKDFGINGKLPISPYNLSPILQRFRDIAGFCPAD